MFALIFNGELHSLVNSTDGYEVELYEIQEYLGDPMKARLVNGIVVERGPDADDLAQSAVRADELWARLGESTPDQIDTWLANNMNSLADARRVLRFILLALKSIRRNI